jgi:transposase
MTKVAAINRITFPTVARYLKTNIPELEKELESRLGNPLMDKYANIIYKMLRDNFNISDINKYLRHIDEQIDLEDLRPTIRRISERYFGVSPVNKKTLRHGLLKQAERITRNDVIKYITTINKKKSKKIRRHWPLLKKEYPILSELEKAYRYFRNCLNEPTATLIDNYIGEYSDCKIPQIKTFAKGLAKDLTAIKEGITSKINSGFVEGGNNKFKLIKRIAYGRMKYSRLKQKFLVSALF